MSIIPWARYPLLAQHPPARAWLTMQAHLGLAPNTLAAYGRGLQEYFAFCDDAQVLPDAATRLHIAAYVHSLSTRPQRRARPRATAPPVGLANATIQQRLTVVRLYYDYLVEDHLRPDSPLGRGRYTPGTLVSGSHQRGLVPRYQTLPWVPSDEQWYAMLQVVRRESLRNQVMFALAYDTGLRREELCRLETGDLDPAYRLVSVRAEITKGRRARVVPYSVPTQMLYSAYLHHRRGLSRARGPLFLSESRRNRAAPISIWTWSKVVHRLAQQAQVPQFTPHTTRHLCLTDLARAGWDVHEIALFAGHQSIQTTLRYIHLSGRDLAHKVAQSMASVHAARIAQVAEVLT